MKARIDKPTKKIAVNAGANPKNNREPLSLSAAKSIVALDKTNGNRNIKKNTPSQSNRAINTLIR